MSRRRTLLPYVAALSLLAIAASRTSAQSVADLERQAAVIRQQAEVATRAVRLRDSARDASAARDTVQAHALTVEFRGVEPNLVRPAAVIAWQLLDGRYGPIANRLSEARLRVTRDTSTGDTPVWRAGGLSVSRSGPAVAGTSTSFPVFPLTVPADTLGLALAGVAEEAIVSRTDASLRSWLPNPLGFETKDPLWTLVYTELVTAPSRATKGCFAGALDDCRAALGFVPDSLQFERWYAGQPTEWLVHRFAAIARTSGLAAVYSSCVDDHDPQACNRIASEMGVGRLPPPLGEGARTLLLHLALERGGRDAASRLLADSTAPVEARLERAAAIPIDSLVSVWRGRVLAARPESVMVSVAGAWIAVGWAAGLGLVALRSSRWR
jgi:hypothetical protein